ncbi:hypothetical protein A3K86_20975 [Photobacterium jeanii]|uniref:DUF4154 domain-containing protein n=1 Tax=Photobacterium jeanii TaxID=858640 RepID=A0A178K288_9GAMM|nr:YfiR family protein [Photobacterium jeanii]OAN11420.1 hypothetical protein A3K86_20975 [Photobacterium jeanii]PST90940.1 DUF4154 domain-containing protein [Photobacterium jeanii]
MNRFILGVCSLLMCWSAVASVTFDPDKVKAVYLVRFANFIHWPQEKSLEHINYCVVGQNDVTDVLEQVLDSQTVRNKALVFHRVQNEAELNDCQLVYLTPESTKNHTYQLEREGLVSVSDARAFAETQGMVEFREKSGRILPVINIDQADKNNVIVRSQLLRISKIISQPQGEK